MKIRPLHLVQINGKARAVLRQHLSARLPDWELFPESYYHFDSLLPDTPEIPDGWRPLKLDEEPELGDRVWWWYANGTWKWTNTFGMNARTIRRI